MMVDMAEKSARRRVSRDDWLQRGLEVLRERGIAAVKIDSLAKSLGVAKTGFYWHFENRDALLESMLEYWEREYTSVISSNPMIAELAPKERLLAISETIAEHRLAEFDHQISAWARNDPRALDLLEHTYALRMDFVRAAFRELGFRGDELEMRTRLFVCYHSNEEAMFGPQSGRKAARLRQLRVRLLAEPVPK